ncbi:MAG: hypothetical protein B7Y56_10720 [Gallionellales bacterium 35-53-114]|jgi:hypothetical protein|nr:MAG: hypothetical protein B7Y56_10720 [Gallionellales bacterium 35-53-114]OYZ64903.1 MAG: hypothetical protein B7Y04_03880 [Gallionellales bacterium 24-53-125]OZB07559.1 MAG: hypothetical protein B7X61_13135 [Gallionellales bacterium 39-52-133]HQS58762.1 AF1514 family protein [Gallionellaceae bacterium]HQS75102.1 AF1514 family protein [Gallionellaceae bacterium]
MKTVSTTYTLAEHLQGSIQEINVSFYDVVLNYATAHALAVNAAGDAMLLAWYDGKNDVGYPEVQECTGDVPGWLAYAESHGANMAVNINSGEFVFVFTTGL